MKDAAVEWGLPDWRCPSNYGRTEDWTVWRWRWEFSRRREDLRSAFDERAAASYEHWCKVHGKETCLTPDQPGFTADAYISDPFGYGDIPNPRISEQPSFRIAPFEGSGVYFYNGPVAAVSDVHGIEIEANQVAAVFDLNQPLADQLAGAKRHLERRQKVLHGKQVQRRRHPVKWLTYLRVLDGRECGASWSEIAAILPATAGTEQTARDTWDQARALCFNF